MHVNTLELTVIHLALKAFLPQVQNAVVQMVMDMSAMYYLNKQEGAQLFQLRNKAIKLLVWCILYNMYPIALQAVAEYNEIVEQLSRDSSQMYEWSLKESVIQNIFSHWHKSIHHPIQYEMPLLLLKSGFRKSIIDTRLFP